MFKKLVLTLAVVTSLFVSAPKAEAGVIVGLIAGDPGKGALIGGGIGLAIGVVTLISSGDELDAILNLVITLPVLTSLGTVLDVDSALTEDELAKAFQNKYAFIDNQESIMNLTKTVKAKFSNFAKNNPKMSSAYISVSYAEVKADLEASDLTNAQIEQIASDLE